MFKGFIKKFKKDIESPDFIGNDPTVPARHKSTIVFLKEHFVDWDEENADWNYDELWFEIIQYTEVLIRYWLDHRSGKCHSLL